jgi:hypothetical protein
MTRRILNSQFSILNCLFLAACGSALEPSPNSLRVTGITPNNGTTLGGTTVAIAGSNFGTGATVTIGGAAATEVLLLSSSSITAKTPQHAAGAADVAVSVGTQRGVLPQGYTFMAPARVVNEPPLIGAITVRGAGALEPPGYATLGETVNVSFTVSDAETPVNQLMYTWSSDVGGAFAVVGSRVAWAAPAELSGTPRTATLTLVVTERYNTTDGLGLPTTAEHRVTGTSAVRVHNSPKEVGDLAVQFLLDFSRQIDPNQVMRNFTPTCAGTAEELGDVQNNQRNFLITSYNVGAATTTVPFSGRCPFRNRFGHACASVPVEWHSTIKATGKAIWTRGFDQVTAVLENDQWKLCDSSYEEIAASPLLPFGFRFKR